ncbi:hypothetical protein AX279_06420 [Pseudomonas sp. J237]|nr:MULTISPECIES: DUF2937 family protein [Pseudomonas]OEO26442.1 hypothetical protein AX279_06420 [Pseudomonas sp. J237]
MLMSYLRLALFALGLLIGVQIPGFMADYSKRVDAHLTESTQSIQGFRATASRFFGGDLNKLIAYYRESKDPVMRNDAQSVSRLVSRAGLLEAEAKAMQGPWYAQAWHLLTRADPALLNETYAAYRYQVLLAPEAIAWGIACALLLAWLIEGLLRAIGWLLGFRGDSRTRQRHW